MKSKQNGQVLPLGLVLVVLGVVGALILFNTSQLASDKMRLANSADAAAYSGALWQARALNYQAYANRAMLANQVAIAQAVTLQSWMTYAVVISGNIGTALRLVPVLNVFTSGLQSVAEAAERAVSLGANAILRVSNAITLALSASQELMYAATFANTIEIISAVARETDPRFTAHSVYGVGAMALNANQWRSFSTRHNKRDISAMQERQQLIMASRDEFTSARNWDLFDWWVPSTALTWHKLRRQGATQLVSVRTAQGMEWEWVAKDTMSLHTKVLGFFSSDLTELPLSWASAYANSRNSRQRVRRQACGTASTLIPAFATGRCSRFLDDNHVAEELADTGFLNLSLRRTLEPMYGYGGVRSFRVLSDDARSAEDAKLTLRVEVSLPATERRDSDTIMNSEQLSAPVVVAGNTLSALSTAEVFYRRPNHYELRPSQREKANGYSPYWQAKLSPVSSVERAAALVARSGGAAPTTHTGVSQ